MNVTLAKYWERLDRNDRSLLLNVLQTFYEPKLHMGRLPFVDAGIAYRHIFNLRATHGNVQIIQRILQILDADKYDTLTAPPKDVQWKLTNGRATIS